MYTFLEKIPGKLYLLFKAFKCKNNISRVNVHIITQHVAILRGEAAAAHTQKHLLLQRACMRVYVCVL